MKFKIFIIVVTFLVACQTQPKEEIDINDAKWLHQAMDNLTEVIVNDIFSPPVASRIYAYSFIAAYEAMRPAYPGYQSLAGQINEFTTPPKPDPNLQYFFPLASLQAFFKIAAAFTFDEALLQKYQSELFAQFKTALTPKVYANSLAYGEQVAQHVLNWASTDNYKQTRTFPKFEVTNVQGRWQPTPPAYMDAIEPHWNKIRTLVLDSAAQFMPAPPTKFDLSESSKFFQEIKEVYETKLNLTDEQHEMAAFWDCNPYVSHFQGHVMYASKKITPGGHWIKITSIVTRQANFSFMESLRTYTLVSIALFDGFIACWDEKFRSNLVRPESVIAQTLDPNWEPFLQTPPFPEYPSGHSVISSAAAIVLTDVFGDNFQYTDSTEVVFNLPARTFNSFIEASEEAAISRLYGGIHFRPGIENGVVQGRQIGNLVIQKIKL